MGPTGVAPEVVGQEEGPETDQTARISVLTPFLVYLKNTQPLLPDSLEITVQKYKSL